MGSSNLRFESKDGTILDANVTKDLARRKKETVHKRAGYRDPYSFCMLLPAAEFSTLNAIQLFVQVFRRVIIRSGQSAFKDPAGRARVTMRFSQ